MEAGYTIFSHPRTAERGGSHKCTRSIQTTVRMAIRGAGYDMASPSPSSPDIDSGQRSPACVLASAISRKYKRIRTRPSPLSDHVRRRLLSKLSSAESDPDSERPLEPVGR